MIFMHGFHVVDACVLFRTLGLVRVNRYMYNYINIREMQNTPKPAENIFQFNHRNSNSIQKKFPTILYIVRTSFIEF